MRIARILLIAIFCCMMSGSAEAKWWIFGQTENEISTRYLYLNGVSYDELGTDVTIYRELLENGQVVLRGKAATTSSAVASVQVSLDDKATWEKAKKASDGAFEYTFRPETGKAYVIYVKIIDTTGKTNDVDETKKQITVSDQNISALIREAMDEMIAAYIAEDPARFMAMVSDNFVADPSVLDRAIRKDFSYFDNIDLRYTLNNVTAANGKIYAAFNFNRSITSSRSGKTLTDKGASEFVFSLGEKGPQVFSMKNPLIFGLSDASDVATGTAYSSTNDPIIVVTSKGDVITQAFADAIKTIENGGVVESGADTTEAASFSLTSTCYKTGSCNYPGFNFAEGEVVDTGYDIYLELNMFFIDSASIGYVDLGDVGINDVTEAPASGYTMGPTGFMSEGNEGHTFALIINGKYALLEVVSFSSTDDDTLYRSRSNYRYKYQPNGTRQF